VKIYRFEGIGEASAAVVMASLSANPTFIPITTGFIGKITFFTLKVVFMLLASLGLIVLNVGVAKVETIIDGNNFDESWDTAENIIRLIRESGKEITPAEAKAIDDPVIAAFRKFANFGKTKKNKL
jgi:hypothetical protein